MNNTDLAQMRVSVTALASLTGVSRQWITKQIDNGAWGSEIVEERAANRGGNGSQLILGPAVKAICGAKSGESVEEAKRKLAEEQAEGHRLKNEETRRERIPLADVMREVEALIEAIKAERSAFTDEAWARLSKAFLDAGRQLWARD